MSLGILDCILVVDKNDLGSVFNMAVSQWGGCPRYLDAVGAVDTEVDGG